MSVELAVPWYITWRVETRIRDEALDQVADTIMGQLAEFDGDIYDVDLLVLLTHGDVLFAGYVDAAAVEDAYQTFRSHVKPVAAPLQPYTVVEIGARLVEVGGEGQP